MVNLHCLLDWTEKYCSVTFLVAVIENLTQTAYRKKGLFSGSWFREYSPSWWRRRDSRTSLWLEHWVHKADAYIMTAVRKQRAWTASEPTYSPHSLCLPANRILKISVSWNSITNWRSNVESHKAYGGHFIFELKQVPGRVANDSLGVFVRTFPKMISYQERPTIMWVASFHRLWSRGNKGKSPLVQTSSLCSLVSMLWFILLCHASPSTME